MAAHKTTIKLKRDPSGTGTSGGGGSVVVCIITAMASVVAEGPLPVHCDRPSHCFNEPLTPPPPPPPPNRFEKNKPLEKENGEEGIGGGGGD